MLPGDQFIRLEPPDDRLTEMALEAAACLVFLLMGIVTMLIVAHLMGRL